MLDLLTSDERNGKYYFTPTLVFTAEVPNKYEKK